MKYASQFQRSNGSGFLIAGVCLIAVLSVGGTAHAETASGPSREVNIANNGFVLVRNATIASISGTIITAEIAWGSSTLSWEVRTDKGTQFVRSDGEIGALSELKEGDTISITGDLDPSLSEPTIIAETVRRSERKAAHPVVALGVEDTAAGTGAVAPGKSSNTVSIVGGVIGLCLILGGGFIVLRSQKAGAARMLSRLAQARKIMRVRPSSLV
jgi:hypothetical protein